MNLARIQYTKTSDGVSIAFSSTGRGQPLLILPGMPVSNVLRESLIVPSFRGGLGPFLEPIRTLIAFDRRGFGLSQRDVGDYSLDSLVLDIEAVVDQLALEAFAMLAPVIGGPLGITYAARSPHRVSHLVLVNSFITGDSFWQSPRFQAFRALRQMDWDTYAEAVGRFYFKDPEEAAALIKESATPEAMRKFMAATEEFDVADLLPQVKCPTLVVHLTGTSMPDPGADEITRLASGIANAGLVVANDGEAMNRAIVRFLTEGEPEPGSAAAETSPVRAAVHTILFTDVEGSTALTQRLGDAAAREVLREHERVVREALAAHAGSEVKTMGDGFMASFASAAGALDCAIAIQRAFVEADRDVGARGHAPLPDGEPIRVRIGLNAGEPIAEEDADGRSDLFGTAVIAAARIAAQAKGGEVLVSNVVRELVAGKGFLFSDRGDAVLRGFDDPVRLYELRWREDAS